LGKYSQYDIMKSKCFTTYGINFEIKDLIVTKNRGFALIFLFFKKFQKDIAYGFWVCYNIFRLRCWCRGLQAASSPHTDRKTRILVTVPVEKSGCCKKQSE